MLLQKVFQFFASAGVAKFSERLRLDLSDSLPRDAKASAHFFKSMSVSVLKSKPEAKDFSLPVGEVVEHFVKLLAENLTGSRLFGARQVLVLEEVAELAVLTKMIMFCYTKNENVPFILSCLRQNINFSFTRMEPLSQKYPLQGRGKPWLSPTP